MRGFIEVMAFLIALDLIAKVGILASGNIPQRTPTIIAVDTVLGVAILCWAAALLA